MTTAGAETDEPDCAGWTPDYQLVPALLAGSPTTMADLSPPDRAWAVAGLLREGHTATQIKDRLGCSLRLVRTVSAWAATAVCALLMDEAEHFGDTYRMQDVELRRLAADLVTAQAAADRYQRQLARVLDSYLVGESGPAFPKCGHPKTKYNTYTAPRTGKTSCRMCHCDAQARYEARKRDNAPTTGAGAVTPSV